MMGELEKAAKAACDARQPCGSMTEWCDSCPVAELKILEHKAKGARPQPVSRPQDWPEDFSHENGNYENRCARCRRSFTGHKRRVVCRICEVSPPPAPAEPTETMKEVLSEITFNYMREDRRFVFPDTPEGRLLGDLHKAVKAMQSAAPGSGWVNVDSMPESVHVEGTNPTHFFIGAAGEIAGCYYDPYYDIGAAGYQDEVPAWIESHTGEQVWLLFDPVAWIPVSALPIPPEDKSDE